MLGDIEVDIQAADVLQGGDHRAAGQVVAHVHLANADGAAERRDNMLLRQRGLELVDRGFVLLQLRGQAVELALGNRLAAHQLAAASVVQLGQAQVGLGSFQQRAFYGAVQLHQGLPGLDLLPGFELHVF